MCYPHHLLRSLGGGAYVVIPLPILSHQCHIRLWLHLGQGEFMVVPLAPLPDPWHHFRTKQVQEKEGGLKNALGSPPPRAPPQLAIRVPPPSQHKICPCIQPTVLWVRQSWEKVFGSRLLSKPWLWEFDPGLPNSLPNILTTTSIESSRNMLLALHISLKVMEVCVCV